MQKSTTAAISDRLRGILTSFIGLDRNSPPSSVCDARDQDSFVERLRSFRSSSWFAKPRWLSPVICARYGWINVDIDLLRCVGCQSLLVVRAPSSFDPSIYSACQKRLEDQLKQDAHHPCCTWPSCPTSEVIILAHGYSSNQTAVVEDFLNRALLLYSVGTRLPAIDQSPLNITESDITALCELVTSCPKFLHGNEVPAAVESAVLLALVGWNLSNGDRTLAGCTSLQCSLCMRQPGLWNYISIVSGDQACSINSGEPRLDDEMNEVEDLQTAGSYLRCDVIDGQFPSCETGGRKLTADDVSVPAAVEDSLPSPTSEKCLDLQKSSASSLSVNANNDAQDMLPGSDTEPCSLAVITDNCEHITDDVPGETDTNKLEDKSTAVAAADGSSCDFSPSESKHSDIDEDFPETTESIGWNENAVCNHLQDAGTVGQEPGSVDIGLPAQTGIEQNKNDSDELDGCPETEKTSYFHGSECEAAASDVDETVNNSTDILKACDRDTHSCEQWENVTGRSPGEVTCSDNVEEIIRDKNNREYVSCVSVEPACGTVNDNLNAKVEFSGEAVHESESRLQLEQPDCESFSPESLQKKLYDADMQETMLNIKHTVR